jgi:hypothetical protein
MNSTLYEFVESSMTEPTFIPLSSVRVNIMFAQFVIEYLSMVLLFDAYTAHNANTSPAPWGGKYLSADKEVRFGNKSESDMFQENQKNLINICMKQYADISWKLFGNKTRNQIGWSSKKIDGIWSLSVRYVKQLTDGGVISSHQNYVDSFSGDKRKEAMWIHHFISSNFFMPSSKRFQISILFMITILCLFITSTKMRNRIIQTSLETCLPLCFCGWERGFSLFTYN